MSNKKIHEILSVAYKRKLNQNPGYSQRALARDLGVSPSFITNLLNGKKRPPQERLEKLIKILELDPIEQRQFSQALVLAKVDSRTVSKMFKRELDTEGLNRKVLTEVKNDNLLSEWWFIPVMEALSLDSTVDQGPLRSRLGLNQEQWDRAVQVLLQEGLIESSARGYRKKENHVYLSSGRSRSSIRSFHKKMIEKSLKELEKTGSEDFERRLITGYTLSLSSEQIEELKETIMIFLDKVTQNRSDDKCTEVYQFNVQLFPHTKKRGP